MLKSNFTPSLNSHSFLGRRSRALAQVLPTYKRRKGRDLQTEGFTIIEVVLVLAIAGLIFLMVFIALPALQRSQRDTHRKRDVDNFLSAVQRYQANNRGRIPPSDSTLHDFKISYMQTSEDGYSGEFLDPASGRGYIIAHNETGVYPGIEVSDNHLEWAVEQDRKLAFYIVGAKCDGQTTVPVNGSNKVAIAMAL